MTSLASSPVYAIANVQNSLREPQKILKIGAACRIRTGDPLITNEMLYQLS